jgi:hypothetical protein
MDVRQLLSKSEADAVSRPEHLRGVPEFDTLETRRLSLVRGEILNLQVQVECDVPLRFQWYFGSLQMEREQRVPGQTGQILRIATNWKTPSGHYRCRVFNEVFPEGVFSGWFFVLMKRRRMGPQKRFFVQVRRS